MIQTPCVGICKQHKEYHVCLGCFRTRMDIFNWATATDKEKLQIIANAQQKATIFGDILDAN